MNLLHLQAALYLEQDVIIQVDTRVELREARQMMYSNLGRPQAVMGNRYKYNDYWIEFVVLDEQPGYESDKLIFYVGETEPSNPDSSQVGNAMHGAILVHKEFDEQGGPIIEIEKRPI